MKHVIRSIGGVALVTLAVWIASSSDRPQAAAPVPTALPSVLGQTSQPSPAPSPAASEPERRQAVLTKLAALKQQAATSRAALGELAAAEQKLDTVLTNAAARRAVALADIQYPGQMKHLDAAKQEQIARANADEAAASEEHSLAVRRVVEAVGMPPSNLAK